MTPATRNIKIRPGTTFGPLVFTGLDADGNPVDLTGWSAWAEARDVPGGTLRLNLLPQIVTSGSVGNFTVNASTDTLTLTAHGLILGETVRFSSSGTLPAGLTAGTNYYVISEGLTANTFKVSATPNGTEVDITDIGSGTHTVSLGLGQILIPEITDETTHDWTDYKGKWDLILQNPAGKRLGAYVSGSFRIERGITNPAA
jgi:hypothetical protein